MTEAEGRAVGVCAAPLYGVLLQQEWGPGGGSPEIPPERLAELRALAIREGLALWLDVLATER